MFRAAAILLSAVFLTAAAVANAAPIRWDFEAIVTGAATELAGAEVGDRISGSWLYELDGTVLEFSLETPQGQLAASGLGTFSLVPSVPDNSAIRLDVLANGNILPGPSNVQISLFGDGLFPEIPDTPPASASLTQATIVVGARDYQISGMIDQLSLVPEPSAIVLMTLAIGAVSLRRRTAHVTRV